MEEFEMLEKIYLDGLDCANCARKIEEQVQKLNGVKAVTLNFTTSTMNIQFNDELDQEDNQSIQNITQEVKEIIKRIEPHVKVRPIQEGAPERDEEPEDIISRNELIKLGIGIIFFILAILLNSSFPIKLALYLISYCLIGGEVVLTAFRNI